VKELVGLEDLRGALTHEEGPVVLFKHSTRCSISAEALGEYQSFVRTNPTAALYTIVDLLAHWSVSEAIEAELGVRHESPQAIVVEQGGVRAVLNHGAIRAQTLGSLLLP
jgi:bacillithiol system protein YtxJ